MTFPLGSLQRDGAQMLAAQRSADAADLPRWRPQMLLFAGGVLWLLMLLALASHRATDPGFSTSGTGAPVANWAGLLGAWASDLALFLFGYSAWWLMLVGARAWLALLARSLRGPLADESPSMPAWWFWAGLVLLMAASCGLEWTRLYRLDAAVFGG